MAEVAGQHLDRGARISRYEVMGVIGAGGFGITYKAYDTRLQCEVAMKEYLPVELAARGSDQSTVLPRSQEVSEEYRHGLSRFLDEARVLARFKNRHIVRVSDFMEVNGTAYLVMDYEEGQSLAELLSQRGGPLSEVEIKNIFVPILDGLKAVHDAGLLHRDIKPDNIYLRKHGPPVLLDFGAARQHAASQTRSLTAVVTPGYAPFEQYQPNAELGPWSDLYGIGATMYVCITGKPPVDAITRHPGVKADPLPPAVEVGGDRYSEILLRSVDWMLRPDANERPQSVDEVLPCIQGRAEPPRFDGAEAARTVAAPTVAVPTAVATPGAGATVPLTPPTEKLVPGQGERRARPVGLIAGIAAATLAIAGAGWWYVQGGSGRQPAVQAKQEQPGQGKSMAREEGAGAPVEPQARTQPTSGESTSARHVPTTESAESTPATEEPSKPERQQGAERAATQVSATEQAQTASAQSAPITQPANTEIASTGEPAGTAETSQPAAEPEPSGPATSAEPARVTQAPPAVPKGQATGKTNNGGQTQAARTSPATQEPPPSPAATPAQKAGGSEVTMTRPAKEPDTDRVTENVDEFLASLTSEANSAKAGTTVASAAPDTGRANPAASEVDELLEKAARYMASSNLVEPEGENARMVYQQVLAMDAGNREARLGMNRIGDVYARAAAIMLDEGHPDLARRVIERGLAAVPNHPGLLQLQDRARAQ